MAFEALSSVDNILLVSEVTALLSDLGLSHTGTIFTGVVAPSFKFLNDLSCEFLNGRTCLATPNPKTNHDSDPRIHPTPTRQIRTLKSS